MAGRPRTPAKILELKGSFRKDPQRRRKEAQGTAPFDGTPPTHLAERYVPAWQEVVSRLPRIVLFNTDELAVEVTARLLADFRAGDNGLAKELRQWFGRLGMTPVDRAKLAPAPDDPQKNPFDL